jgi:uncharacterized protein (DUF1800 family)
MRRAHLVQLTLAIQAAVAAAACGPAARTGRPANPLNARRTQIAHLLRRAGFGASKEQIDEFQALGITAAVDRLLDYDKIEDDTEDRIRSFDLNLRKAADLQRWWLLRMIYSKRQLQERMVLFWHGLLTSAYSKVGLPNPTPQNPNPPQYMLDQHTFFRQHATDTFETIILGISRDPAMMVWLDAQTNNKAKPNENYARELMELFTLGIAGPDGTPNYTEQDVREVARAFTGWGLDRGQFVFRANNHDAGMKFILGKSGAFNGGDVAKLLVAQPAAARYLSRRLFEYFAFPDPTEKDVEPLVKTYIRTGGDVKAMLRALFTSPVFYSPRAYRSRVKSPVELTVGAIRALGVVTDAFSLPGVTARMGQALFNPPNVAGWPGGIAWLNSSTWLERMNFGNSILVARDDAHTIAPPLSVIVERNNLKTPEAIVDYFAGILLDGNVPPAMRKTLLDYMMGTPMAAAPGAAAATLSPGAKALPPNLLRPAFIDQKVRGMVYLILASPEFQLL